MRGAFTGEHYDGSSVIELKLLSEVVVVDGNSEHALSRSARKVVWVQALIRKVTKAVFRKDGCFINPVLIHVSWCHVI